MFQETFKNFNINFNALNERNTVSSGDPLTGQVSFDLSKDTKISSITMRLKGQANVQWSTGGGGSRKRRRRRRVHSAKLEFFDLKAVIMQASSITDDSVTLQPGTHMYPFSCQLPVGNFPSSFRGVHGRIIYNMTVGIKRPWHLKKEFETVLNFVHHINMNQPELQAPLSGSNQTTVCSLFCTSNLLSMTARTEKKAFIPGETVKITCEFSNGTTRTVTPKVKLLQKQHYSTTSSAAKSHFSQILESVTGQPISAHTPDVYTELMLSIPSSAALSISNCSILTVEYVIEVSLSGWCVPELLVLFPIILYEPPLQINLHPHS